MYILNHNKDIVNMKLFYRKTKKNVMFEKYCIYFIAILKILLIGNQLIATQKL